MLKLFSLAITMQYSSISSFLYLVWIVATVQLLFCSAGPVNLTAPLRHVPNQFVQRSNIACNYGTNSNYFPTFAISSTGVWLGSCNDRSGLVTLDTNGLFTSFVSDNSYGTHFQFAANSTDINPILVPIDGLVRKTTQSNSNPVGELHVNPFQWQSYRNDSACIMNGSPTSSVYFAYSAASDTFYTFTPLCSKAEIRMRRASSPFDQPLDAYCLSDWNYYCFGSMAIHNDGITDHLFQLASPNSVDLPIKVFRQSLMEGGPSTNVTVVATGSSTLCSSTSVRFQVHPKGKMLFGACDTGLFYVDLGDPFPTTIPAIQRVSTCSSANGGQSNPLIVTNDRAYIICGSVLRAYSLAVNSNGVVTVSDTNYINISPIECSSYASTIIPSMVVGRPDAIWTRCDDGGLYSNICGFGYALSVAPAGDTYACTACASGTYQSSYGFSSDLSCTACAVGTYLASPTDPNCTFCAVGKYQPSTSATTCLQCPLGKYQPATGASSCLACDLPYTTTSSVGATNFSQCSQEICEVPGSNPLYCVSVSASAALHQPLSFIVSAGITILAVAISARLI